MQTPDQFSHQDDDDFQGQEHDATESHNPNSSSGSKKASQPVKKIAEEVKPEPAPAPQRSYRLRVFQVYLLVAMLVFIVLALLARTVAYFPVDLAITEDFQGFRPSWFSTLMWAISWIGYWPEAFWIALGFVVLILAFGFRWEGLTAVISGVLAQGISTLVKIGVRRPRPGTDIVNVVRQLSTFSFPSGHVTFYVSFYGFLFFLSYTVLKPSWLRSFLLVLFGSLVLLVGPSRIYLGAHWATDVLAGYLIGSLVLTASVLIYRWGKEHHIIKKGIE